MVPTYKYDKYFRPVMSRIIAYNDEKDWKDSNVELPEIDQEVVVRICDNDDVTEEDDLHVFVVEELKFAKLNKNKEWEILPPHPMFDCSLLSNNEKLEKYATVTHWYYPDEIESKKWKTRFDRKEISDKLEVNVDNKMNAELVYKSLNQGIEALKRQNDVRNPQTEAGQSYLILKDLMNSIHYEENSEMKHEPIFKSDELPSSFDVFKRIVTNHYFEFNSERDAVKGLFYDIPIRLIGLIKVCNKLNDLVMRHGSEYVFILAKKGKDITVISPEDILVRTDEIKLPIYSISNTDEHRCNIGKAVKNISEPYTIKMYMFKTPETKPAPGSDLSDYFISGDSMIDEITRLINEEESEVEKS